MAKITIKTKKPVKVIEKNNKPPTKFFMAAVIDESGSMENLQDATINAYNEFITTQKKLEIPTSIYLTKFATKVELLAKGVEPKKLQFLTKETYSPSGWTALYDAVGHTIKEMQAEIKASKVKNFKAMVTIFSDGAENKSTEYSRTSIASMIKELTAEGWAFTYIGSNAGAYEQAVSMGISSSNVLKVASTARGMQVNSRAVRMSQQAYLGGASNDALFNTTNAEDYVKSTD